MTDIRKVLVIDSGTDRIHFFFSKLYLEFKTIYNVDMKILNIKYIIRRSLNELRYIMRYEKNCVRT